MPIEDDNERRVRGLLEHNKVLRARVAELEAWLRKDARHAPRCMMLDQYDERDFGCTCGLDALRAGLSGGTSHGS